MTQQNKKNNLPTLRFQEFQDDWKLIKLCKLFNFKNGINADKAQYGTGVKFINVLDIINNKYITYDNIIGRVAISDKELEKNKVEYGDILFQRSSETREEVGQANVYLDKKRCATFGGFVIRGKKTSNYEPLFIKNTLSTSFARKEITSRSGGSTRYNVGQDTLKNIPIPLPTLPEQKKIASFLSAVDQKIEQLIRKKKLLIQYKRGVMQKIFSQEIKFPKFGRQWSSAKIRDIGTIRSGTTPLRSEELFFKDGTVPWVKTKDLNNSFIDETEEKVTSLALEKTSLKLFPRESILVAMYGGFKQIGRTGFLNIEAATNQALSVINTTGEVTSEYLLAWLNANVAIWRRFAGSSRKDPNITGSDVGSFPIHYPSLPEQQKIATFLTNIDQKIEATQSQLSQTKTFKSGLLQQMFV